MKENKNAISSKALEDHRMKAANPSFTIQSQRQ